MLKCALWLRAEIFLPNLAISETLMTSTINRAIKFLSIDEKVLILRKIELCMFPQDFENIFNTWVAQYWMPACDKIKQRIIKSSILYNLEKCVAYQVRSTGN